MKNNFLFLLSFSFLTITIAPLSLQAEEWKGSWYEFNDRLKEVDSLHKWKKWEGIACGSLGTGLAMYSEILLLSTTESYLKSELSQKLFARYGIELVASVYLARLFTKRFSTIKKSLYGSYSKHPDLFFDSQVVGILALAPFFYYKLGKTTYVAGSLIKNKYF